MPVMLLPGFLAGDQTLLVLGEWLRRMGYPPHRGGFAFNVDCSDRTLDRLDARVERIHAEAGRPVALVGHSRGGHFAKALAHRRPERVAAVVSMGAGLDTPFDVSVPTKAAVAAARWVHGRTTDRVRANGCFTESCRCRFTRDFAGDFPRSVPMTSIYSRGDGVVWWEACVVPYARNVEIDSSHVGMAFNAQAYRAIGEALAGAARSRQPAAASL